MRLRSAFLLLFVLAGSAFARQNSTETGLSVCATVGPLRTHQGTAIELQQHIVPPVWGITRQVDFQVCDDRGRPVKRRVLLNVDVETASPQIGAKWLGSRSVTTDGNGRFRGTYGAANMEAGPAWPAGVPNREIYRFSLDGRTIATFQLERTANDVLFTPIAAGGATSE